MRLRRAFWGAVHNLVAHGIEGFWMLLTIGAPNPDWLDAFHDWTADKAWGLR